MPAVAMFSNIKKENNTRPYGSCSVINHTRYSCLCCSWKLLCIGNLRERNAALQNKTWLKDFTVEDERRLCRFLAVLARRQQWMF